MIKQSPFDDWLDEQLCGAEFSVFGEPGETPEYQCITIEEELVRLTGYNLNSKEVPEFQ